MPPIASTAGKSHWPTVGLSVGIAVVLIVGGVAFYPWLKDIQTVPAAWCCNAVSNTCEGRPQEKLCVQEGKAFATDKTTCLAFCTPLMHAAAASQ